MFICGNAPFPLDFSILLFFFLSHNPCHFEKLIKDHCILKISPECGGAFCLWDRQQSFADLSISAAQIEYDKLWDRGSDLLISSIASTCLDKS